MRPVVLSDRRAASSSCFGWWKRRALRLRFGLCDGPASDEPSGCGRIERRPKRRERRFGLLEELACDLAVRHSSPNTQSYHSRGQEDNGGRFGDHVRRTGRAGRYGDVTAFTVPSGSLKARDKELFGLVWIAGRVKGCHVQKAGFGEAGQARSCYDKLKVEHGVSRNAGIG